MDFQVQEANQTKIDMTRKKTSLSHIIVKMLRL
jgi:hypothetical protein